MNGKERRKDIPAGSIWRHYKGNCYCVIDLALHSETLEPLVIYRDVDCPEKVWARPLSMWEETVSVGGVRRPRFERESDRFS